jgi:soluble P-type ATPase
MAKKSQMSVTAGMLFKHCYETMQSLKKNETSVEVAKAQSSLVKQCNSLLRYELDRAIAIQQYENIEIRELES